jgi:hypothetical protein
MNFVLKDAAIRVEPKNRKNIGQKHHLPKRQAT